MLDDLVLKPEEGKKLFERECQKLLGLPAHEVYFNYSFGEYDNIPDTEEGRNIMLALYYVPFYEQWLIEEYGEDA